MPTQSDKLARAIWDLLLWAEAIGGVDGNPYAWKQAQQVVNEYDARRSKVRRKTPKRKAR